MNIALLADLVLSFGATFMQAQGNQAAVSAIDKLRQAHAAGHEIDEHMATVAELLQAGPLSAGDWTALEAELDVEIAAFLDDT